MVSFLAANGRCLDPAMADGNCLFRAVSKQLCGDSEEHAKLRMVITDYVASNPSLFSGWTTENESVEQRVTKMRNIGCWGSHLQLKAVATIFQKSVYVATDSLVPGQCRWIVFPSFPDACLPEVSTFNVNNQKSWLEVSYTSGCHYDGILPIRSDKPLNPPTLTGRTLTLKL